MSLHPLRNSSELSKQWLQNMLHLYSKSDVELHEYKITIPDRKDGFLSEICYVNIHFSVSGEIKKSNLVFKFLPSDDELQSFIKSGGLAEREVSFYKFSQSDVFQSVIKDGRVSCLVPDVLYCSLQQSALTIVMADVREAGYRQVVRPDGSSLVETIAALRSAALVHAAGLLYHRHHGCFPVTARQDNDIYDQYLIPNLKYLANWCKDEALSEKFLRLVPLATQMLTCPDHNPLFNTVIHGDLWAGQAMFSNTDTSSFACLLDWQFCRVGNPVLDIQAMFLMSTDPTVLETHLNEVLLAYWNTLKTSLEDQDMQCPVTFEQLNENVERLWMFGLVFLATSIQSFLVGQKISNTRLKKYIDFFLDRNGVFSMFL